MSSKRKQPRLVVEKVTPQPRMSDGETNLHSQLLRDLYGLQQLQQMQNQLLGAVRKQIHELGIYVEQ